MEERKQQDPSTQDVLDAINNFAECVEQRFSAVDQRFDNLESDVGKIKATMVTKDYLDTKMFQLRGDLMGYDKQADAKTDALVDVLHTKKVLDSKTASDIKGLSPFKRKTIAL